jgi:predicted ATP-grasp superfamily ATP-dependent carboligase
VLVLDGGSGPALAVVRSLGRAGWRVRVPAGTRAAASRWVQGLVEVPPADEDPAGFVEGVARALERAPADLVVPCIDASVELLWANEDILGSARILGGDRRSFELGTDKGLSLEAADAAGFGTPEWVIPATLEQARAELPRIGLPAVVKPRRSYVAEGSKLRHRRHSFVRSAEELERVLAGGTGADGSAPIMQSFVPGRSLAVTAVVHDGRVLAFAARETLSFDPIEGGTSVWKRTVPADTVGVQGALELLRSVRYEGLAEVEYQVPEDGRERLMEIGVRAHGWVPLAVAAGVDLPLIAAQALFGEPVSAGEYRSGVEMRWPAGELSRLRRAAARHPDLPPDLSRAAVFRSAWPPWRPGMHYDGIDLSDPAPWLPAYLRRRAERRRPGVAAP